MGGINLDGARRDGAVLDGLVDGREQNDISRRVNDDAAACQAGDDFLFAILLRASGDATERQRGAENQEVLLAEPQTVCPSVRLNGPGSSFCLGQQRGSLLAVFRPLLFGEAGLARRA